MLADNFARHKIRNPQFRKNGVTTADIAKWRDEFITNGTHEFKKNPEESRPATTSRTSRLENARLRV